MMTTTLNFSKKYYYLAAFFLVALQQNLIAQSFIGQTMDNYAGVHGVIVNPANVYDTPFRTDINLISASGYLGNDYISLSISDLMSSNEFNFDDNTNRHPSESNHFYANLDVMGPSFLLNIGDKQSIGVTTRVRGLFNIDNINGGLYERIEDGFELGDNFDFDSKNLNGTVHVFSEIGFTYGREIIKTQDQFLKGGISLKYLMGAGGLFTNSPELSGNFNGTTNILNTRGSITYGMTPGFESDLSEFGSLQGGFGADIGLVYEYRQRIVDGSVLGKRPQQYKFKLGLSVTDIGSINYKNSEITSYDANGDVNGLEFETKDIEEILEDNYSGSTVITDQKVLLPTALQIMADYYIGNKWYVGLHSGLSMRKAGNANTNNTINTTTIAPRWETKHFSVYSPLGIRQYGGFSWGFGFRAGPLTIGSSSALTNLFSDNSKSTDIYIGLKIPLYKNISY